ncbi:MAG: acylphosphatase [Rickettsiales bacterium]|nr:acylphosphatase [Rickettsiales bacterium]
MQRLHLLISGRVQGVWFRASTQRQARGLELVGWVRNLRDGRVEALAEGPEDVLKKLLTWARRGPPAARVDHVELSWSAAGGGLDGFEIRADGSGEA